MSFFRYLRSSCFLVHLEATCFHNLRSNDVFVNFRWNVDRPIHFCYCLAAGSLYKTVVVRDGTAHIDVRSTAADH